MVVSAEQNGVPHHEKPLNKTFNELPMTVFTGNSEHSFFWLCTLCSSGLVGQHLHVKQEEAVLKAVHSQALPERERACVMKLDCALLNSRRNDRSKYQILQQQSVFTATSNHILC